MPMEQDWRHLKMARHERESKRLENIDEQTYDLSFIYSMSWRDPEKDVKDALKLLLHPGCSADNKASGDPPGQELDELHASGRDLEIRRLLAMNPATPPHVLAALAESGPDAVVERVAANARTSTSALSRLVRHPSVEVRTALAENESKPDYILELLAHDESPDVRYCLAENYNIPITILEELSADENPFVAARAQTTLARLRSRKSVLRLVANLARKVRRMFG